VPAPSFVNVGTRSNGAPQSSRTPALPASLVNGNILICTALTKVDQDHSISGAGWQAVHAQQAQSNFRLSRWWRLVDGTETAPTISWATGTSCFAQISQYSGTDPTNPFGNISHNVASGTTHSSTGFNTTADDSLVIYEDVCNANTAVATPSGWTENYDNGSGTGATRNAGGSKVIATAGDPSGNISVSGGFAQYCQSQIELLAPAGGGAMPYSFGFVA
jgi:hypothetical protein